MNGTIVTFEQVTKRFPGIVALDGVTLPVARGARSCQ